MRLYTTIAIASVILALGIILWMLQGSWGITSKGVTYWDVSKTRLRSVESYDAQGRPHGVSETWSEDGTLSTEIYYNHGQISRIKGYYPNRSLRFDHPFRAGVPHGTWKYWAPNDALLVASEFENGTGTEYYFDDEGREVRQVRWLNGTSSETSQPHESKTE